MKVLVIILVLTLSGCKSTKPIDVEPFEYKFEKTAEQADSERVDSSKVTVRFDGLPFGQAMTVLSQEVGVPIVWSKELDETSVFGTFDGVLLPAVLNVLARRVNSMVAEVGGVYYIGEIKREDRAFAVLRVPPVAQDQFLAAVKQSASQDSAVSIIGSCLWICDNIESLRKVVSAVESIRKRSERCYVAEVYFIRVNEESFVQLTADLNFKQIDIFASAFNMSELFEMFIDGDGSTGWSKISQRPVLFLSEGRKVVFSDGREITREQKSMTEQGAIETTGYQSFSDGTQLTMCLNRVSDKSYAVDVDLSISTFDKNDKAAIPAMERSSIKADGLLIQDSKVYYIGSLRRDSVSSKGGLFSYNGNKSHDMITIWLRVRELQNSLHQEVSLNKNRR
ncbi:hypothetical protein FACS1894189_8060 [Planctomycetales bacterium]|nr:hypothetical protein FACS1894189_8060 [Planctomycetales bacterium]